MATFHALSPPLGSHQSRQAPDLFSIELELLLPDDHFLPAQNIVAQVWTNIIHRLNPDGPETWAAVPMKLSHVSSISASTLEGGKENNSNKRRSVAVFATRIQPTGRGNFGLTARWKAHTDLTEWQWAPTAVDRTLEDEQQRQQNGEPIKNKDVGVSVRVPRSISDTSSWTMGPQSVLIYGQHGPRLDGLLAAPTSSVSSSPSALAEATATGSAMAMIGGPGLYLGNHATATRARISGYDAVLSLVGDLLDFDERIPESDKDVNKNAWLEQAKAKEEARTPPKRFSVLSRSSSISLANGTPEGEGPHAGSEQGSLEGLRRRTSVSDFMARYEPGMTTGLEEEEFLAGVVNEPEEGPRLTRKTSVTEMMVQIPVSASPVSKRLSRASYSVGSIASIAEQGEAQAGKATPNPTDNAATPLAPGTSAVPPKETLHAKTSSVSGSNGNGFAKANLSTPNPPPPSGKKSSKAAVSSDADAAATAATATTATSLPPLTAASTTATPPLSKKEKAKAAAAAASTTAASTAAHATTNAASLPPVSSSSKVASTSSSNSGRSSTSVALSSPTVAHLGIGRAFPSVESSGLSTPSSKDNTDNEFETAAVSKDGKEKDTTNKAPTAINTSQGTSNGLGVSPPPSSANVMSTLTSSFSSSAMISSLATDSKGSTESSKGTTAATVANRPFSHKVISLPPGAHNKISDAALKEAITFLMDQIAQRKKVLVHCRDGNGRSGSVAIAYIVAREQLQQQKELQDGKIQAISRTPAETYEAALNEVWRWKCDVYPHKGLRQSLERIEWNPKA